jgi:hypothetical protein
MNSLIPHDPRYRRRWMVPRNIRSIYPWKISQILALLKQVAVSETWSGNQPLQDQFCKALEAAGLKRAGVQYDPHSGGPRTYLAQLECLGLIFKRGAEIFFTQTGEDMLGGKPPLPLLQKQLLTHQYPSAYGKKPRVLIHPELQVKPFLFVLELLNREEIGFLTDIELAVALVYGHNRACLNICSTKIQELRSGRSISDVIGVVDRYTPRRQRFPDGLLDDANTFKNYLQSCCLVFSERINGRNAIRFDEENRKIYEKYLHLADEYIECHDDEGFQRRYGSRTKRGDTRQIPDQKAPSIDPAASIILSHFYARCGAEFVTQKATQEFVREMRQDYGFSPRKVKEAIGPHLNSTIDYFESTYIELSRSGDSRDAIKFEKATQAIFRDRLRFVVEHTGQRRRPKGVGGYADLFLIAEDNQHCAIVDTKASPRYSLPHADCIKMTGTYIPNYSELCAGRELELEFASYVAGGYSGDVLTRLREIQHQGKVPCSAITARKLLQIAKSKPADQEACRAMLSKSCVYG